MDEDDITLCFSISSLCFNFIFAVGSIFNVWSACEGFCLIAHQFAVQTGPRRRRQQQQHIF